MTTMKILVTALAFFWTFVVSVVSTSTHTSNVAVLVSSSRYWFNYRHPVNVLSIYAILKSNGFTDDDIILMIADDYATNSRNPFKNQILLSGQRQRLSIDSANVEIDYRGGDVTVDAVVRVLTGQPPLNDGPPVLQSDENTNILIYWTGHGGDQFFKFQDLEEIVAADIASVLQQMHLDGRYHEILFVADTCQAFTLADPWTAPNVTFVASSLRDESSYADHSDAEVGVAVVEKYTHALAERLRKGRGWRRSTLKATMVDPFAGGVLRANIGYDDSRSVRKADAMLVSDFFQQAAARHEKHDGGASSAEFVPRFIPETQPDFLGLAGTRSRDDSSPSTLDSLPAPPDALPAETCLENESGGGSSPVNKTCSDGDDRNGSGIPENAEASLLVPTITITSALALLYLVERRFLS